MAKFLELLKREILLSVLRSLYLITLLTPSELERYTLFANLRGVFVYLSPKPLIFIQLVRVLPAVEQRVFT